VENINTDKETETTEKSFDLKKTKEETKIEEDVSFFDKGVRWKVIFGAGDETEDSYLWE